MRMATTPIGCAPIRCSRWRSTLRRRIASCVRSPTISRLENLPDARALLRMGRHGRSLLRVLFQGSQADRAGYRRHVRRRSCGQQLRLFNAHYDEYGFQATRKAMQDSADPLSQQAHMYFHTFLRVAKYQGSDQALMELARD